MSGKVLAETVARYNGFVKAGKDEDFDKPTQKHEIAQGPFYAAWATFAVHDSYAGLRIDGDCTYRTSMGRSSTVFGAAAKARAIALSMVLDAVSRRATSSASALPP